MDRGFILHPTYMIEQGRAVVHLFGVTDEAASFVIRDTQARPSFFLRQKDLSLAEPILSEVRHELKDQSWQTMQGEDAVEVSLAVPPEVPPLRDRLRAAGIECHEADIPFVTRYLCDRGIRGAVGIDGTYRKGRRVNRIYENVRLEPGDFEPDLRLVSIDIETDLTAEHVLSFALYGVLPHGGRVEEVHFWRDPARTTDTGIIGEDDSDGFFFEHRNESVLLRALVERMREIDPDVLTGWNVVDFDLRVLEQAFGRCGVPFYIGRADLPCRVRARDGSWMTSRATVHGRAVIDGIDLLRGAFIRLDNYALDGAARELLGEGKTITGDDRGTQIERMYREDLGGFLRYNLTDARLVIEILAKKNLLPLAIRRALLTGLPLDRVAASIASFDFLYIGALHRRGIVAPSVQEATTAALAATPSPDAESQPAAIGGYVLDSTPGIYDNVWLFDYQSLYPSIIRTFRIDPLGHARAFNDPDAEAVTAPNEARFLREEGILPDILEELIPRRLEAKRRGAQVESLAIKIIMNSFYGVLASPRCRFFSTYVSNAITTFGQQILLWTKDRLEKRGYQVIYGDTDSVFVVSGIALTDESEDAARAVVADLNRELSDWVKENHDMESHLHLEFERQYVKFFMPSLRHTVSGSKKRYAGVIERAGVREIVFTGLESVRRDWTVLSKDFQRHLLMRVFEDQPIGDFVKEFLRELRDGEKDGDLVYRKALRKPLAEYGKTTPPHVKAARLIPGKPGRLISYVMTTEGPQPVGYLTAPLDYEHYVEKQLRPIGESILQHVGRSFDEFLGKGDQLGLL